MRMMSIASGSSGNCIYVGTEETHLLIDTGVSCKKVNEGLNCPDISVAIMLGINSSKTVATQRKGRVIRYQTGKIAEIFTLVLRGTVEEKWFQNSNTEYVKD